MFFACSGKKTVVKNNETNTPPPAVAVAPPVKTAQNEGLEGFLQKFEQALVNHDRVAMLNLMDKDYRREQHDKFYKANTEEFLNAFFCNFQTNGQGFKCIKFTDISASNRIEIAPNDGNYTAVYHITGKGVTIKADWLILVKKDGDKIVYGFYGPVG